MPENIHLLGSEQVSNAAYSIRESVEQFKLAVGWFGDAVTQQQRYMEEWLQRFEAALEKGGESDVVLP